MVVKSAHVERMGENLDMFDFTMSPEDLAVIQSMDTGKTLFGWY